jgi:hypothetical protein
LIDGSAVGGIGKIGRHVPMQIVNERVMRMRLSNHISTACLLPEKNRKEGQPPGSENSKANRIETQ